MLQYEEQVKSIAKKILSSEKTCPGNKQTSYANAVEIFLVDEYCYFEYDDFITLETFYYDLFEHLNLFETCCRIEIAGEFVHVPKNINKFQMLEYLTLPWPRINEQFDSTFLPESIVFFSSYHNNRFETSNYLAGINKCRNLQTLYINTSQISDNVLEDLPHLKNIFIKYGYSIDNENKLVQQYLQKVWYRIQNSNHVRHIHYDSD